MSSTQASFSMTCWWCWVFLLVTDTVLGFYAVLICFSSDHSDFSPWLSVVGSAPHLAPKIQVYCWPSPVTWHGLPYPPPLPRLYTKSSPNPYCPSALFAYLQIQMPNGPPIDISNSTPLFMLKGLRIHLQAPNSSPFWLFDLTNSGLNHLHSGLYAVNQNFSKPQVQ